MGLYKSLLLPDTECIYKQIITEIAESYGKKYTQEIQLMVLGTTEEMTAQVVVKECGLPITKDEFLQKFREMQTSYLENAKLMNGILLLFHYFQSILVSKYQKWKTNV